MGDFTALWQSLCCFPHCEMFVPVGHRDDICPSENDEALEKGPKERLWKLPLVVFKTLLEKVLRSLINFVICPALSQGVD